MKLIITTLLSLCINTFAMEMTPSEKVEFEKRIELYGLKKQRPLIPNKVQDTYDQAIIQKLQNIINKEYIPDLENKFGTCQRTSCVTEMNNYLELELQTKSICLPYTQCGFYTCMEKKYQCKPQGVDYFTDLAFPTCSTYIKNINKKWFSQKGHDWIYTVMVCLQRGLIDECEVDENCNQGSPKKKCEYITDFTLKFHPGCYTNSGVGVCNLPLKDKINIWRTVGKFLTKREQQEAFKVVLSCIRKEKGL